MASSDRSHPVVFTTATQYPLPAQKFMIPAPWKRYQLSQLVNKSLQLLKPVPFEFLVRGEILRTTLGEWCAEKGVGEEETLEIEYFESVMPPQRMTSLPHEEWVSSVSCQLPGYFVTAAYDGHVRFFDYSQKLVQTVAVHDAPATSVISIPGLVEHNTHLFASSSHDMTARIFETNVSGEDDSFGGAGPKTQILASLHLHTAPISSVASSSNGSHLLTASWDNLIGVWDTVIPTRDEVPVEEGPERKKRRKADENTPKTVRKAPLAVLKSHTGRVSKALYGQGASNRAYSAGLDSTVRTWDVENAVCVETITASSKPFLEVAVFSDGNHVLAASTDRTVTQYDVRSPISSATPFTASFTHPSTPSCIALPGSLASTSTSNHQFLTGAYDGSVRLWDLRSTSSPVASFKAWDGQHHGRKILSVDWATAGSVVGIGGEGGVEVWRVGGGDNK